MTACIACSYDGSLPVKRRWAFYIPRQPASQNEFKGQNRFAYRRHRHEWEQWLIVAAGRIERAPRTNTRVRRVFVYRLLGKGSREYDRGNLVGGSKPLLDAMVNAGLLVDDSAAHCEDHYPAQLRAADHDAHSLADLARCVVDFPVPYDPKAGGVLVVIEELGR